MRKDRQTDSQPDMIKLIVALCDFTNATKNNIEYIYILLRILTTFNYIYELDLRQVSDMQSGTSL